MYNQSVVNHVLVSGDTLYKLANQYHTTIDSLLAANPYLDPYRLKIGDTIFIYPGENGLSDNSLKMSEVELMNKMRSLWEQHVMWTRSLVISIADNLKDINATTNRLLMNPVDIGNLYKLYYGNTVGSNIADLLKQHLVIGGELIKALKAGDMVNVSNLNRAWYKNADDMAFAFVSINPHYVEKDIRDMLYVHLDLLKKDVTNRLASNYDAEVNDFDNTEKHALIMADTFTDGIINQFPNKFI